MMHPDEAQRRIRAGVKLGVERRGEIKPYKLARPVRLEITFKSIINAELASYLPGAERPAGNVVVFTAPDMLQVSKFVIALTMLNTFGQQ